MSIEGVTLWAKWAVGSSGYGPTGGSREQTRASLAWATCDPGKLFQSSPLENGSLWMRAVETIVLTSGGVQEHSRKGQEEGDFLWDASGERPLLEIG